MTSLECKARKWLARDLIALSDVELDQYLEQNRLECGVRVVDVEDPENVPESFIERLRCLANRSPDVAQSRPIDLDKVNALLLKIGAHSNRSRSPSPQPSSPSSSATQSPEPPQIAQTTFYHQLILEGGRPLYPIHLLDDISKSPEAYRDLLEPWQECTDREKPKWYIFWYQLNSWKAFRQWQRRNRTPGYPHNSVEFSAYDTFIVRFRSGTTTYEKGLEKALAHFGFTQPCQVDQDPEQQDKVTTWIEYLAYMCCVTDKCIRRLRREQPVLDEAWKMLLEANVLEASDTMEWICDDRSAFQRQDEVDHAWQEMKSAEAALLSVQKPEDYRQDSGHGSLTPNSEIQVARSRLDTARESLTFLERRSEHLTKFYAASSDYFQAEMNVQCFQNRLKWVADQIPLIKAELEESLHNIRPSGICDLENRCQRDSEDNPSQEIRKRRRKSSPLDSPSSGRASESDHRVRVSKRLKVNTANDITPLITPAPRRSARVRVKQRPQRQP
ncbi:hypothetical protein F5Y03DRAFT_354120 [Xylaria venustula]|nr:hypothetical protein F5Y03DRAFT_354120 [Xylaria venustula]